MKILFVSSWYPSPNNLNKGLFVKKHATSIRRSGTDIIVLALSVNHSANKWYEKKVFSFTDENNVPTHIIELNSKFYKWIHINFFFQYFILKKYYRKNIKPVFNPDVIHSNVIYPAGIIGYRLSVEEKKPSVITEHWTRVNQFLKKSLYSGLGKRAYRNSAVTVVSKFLKETIKAHGVDESRIHIIPNIIEPYFFSDIKSHTGDLVFVCCANWISHKRPDLIFNTLEWLSKKERVKITLHAIGTGVLMDKVKAESWSFKVEYHGFKTTPQIAEIMQKGKYFIHASNDETFSVVIAEALSAGLPVIASSVGAVPELIHPQNGILCENTEEDWQKGILELIKTSYAPAEISQEMQKFLAENIGEKFSGLYASIAENGGV